MNETFAMLIKAIESGELIITGVTMLRPEERRSLPPWAPEESTWSFNVVHVPDKYRIPIDLTKEYLGKPSVDPGAYVYVVIGTSGGRMQINGCFYNKEAAEKYAGDSSSVVIQKLSVL